MLRLVVDGPGVGFEVWVLPGDVNGHVGRLESMWHVMESACDCDVVD